MQGTSATQFLIMLPVLIAPIVLFSIFYYAISFEAAIIVLSILGVIGFAMKNYLLNLVTEQYRKKKYGMIAGFKEKASWFYTRQETRVQVQQQIIFILQPW